jgi:hypothetical protein
MNAGVSGLQLSVFIDPGLRRDDDYFPVHSALRLSTKALMPSF